MQQTAVDFKPLISKAFSIYSTQPCEFHSHPNQIENEILNKLEYGDFKMLKNGKFYSLKA